MRRKSLNIFLFILIGFVVLGIGYAAINNVDLLVNGTGSITATQNNFRVEFTEASITPNTESVGINQDRVSATFSVSSLSKKGDTAVATYTIENFSNNIGAVIELKVNSSNTEYFRVTHHINDSLLSAGEETTATVTIEMIKTPINNDVTTDIVAELIASPNDEEYFPDEGDEYPLTRQVSHITKYGSVIMTSEPNSYAVSNMDDLSDTFAAASTAFEHPASIEFHIDNDYNLNYSNLAFKLGNNPVTILEYGKSNVTANKNTITTLFGSANCSQSGDAYTCSNYDDGELNVIVYDNGSLEANGGVSTWQCTVFSRFGTCFVTGIDDYIDDMIGW